MIVFIPPRNAIKAVGRPACGIALGLLLSGCALSPFDEDSAFRQTSTSIGVTGKLAEPAPFVRDSRPEQSEYPPVGVTPQRPAPPQSALGVSQMTTALDQLRQRNEMIAATARPASPYDGKIEPGYKPPQLPPVPAYTGPAVGAPAEKNAAAAAPAPAAAQKSTNQKPKDKKARAQSPQPQT